MKAEYQHLPELEKSKTLNTFWVSSPKFDFHWHYHPQIEITYVERGFGTRLIGDSVNAFEEGDFVLVGSNLPHTWISSEEFNTLEQDMKVAVLQFDDSLINAQLMSTAEFSYVKRLINDSSRGISFNHKKNPEIVELLLKVLNGQGMEKYASFFTLLDALGQSTNFHFITSAAYLPILNEATETRIQTVCKFIHENFMQNLKLNHIAKLANMNPSSFCRFFKKTTGQSLFEYINDLRISKASNL
ncbi:MAG: AraC family transcriptional regulator, partial [Bacteroidota bacterium]